MRPRADDRRHRARGAHRAARTPSSRRAASRSGRTTGCPTSGSRPTACPASPSRSYLAHPRLAKLERAEMLEVEGGDPESCLRILRHEAGHAIDNAYQLQRRPTRRRLFGDPKIEYPGVLHAEAVQQELRPAPRPLVRAEPSRRRLRRNVRRLARPAVDVGDALRRLAGAAQARIHGPPDARAGVARGRASRRSARSIRCRG